MRQVKLTLGQWRPVQGMLQTYAVYSGITGIINGPTPGQAIASVYGNDPRAISYVFFSALLVGGLLAMGGEIRQLLNPVFKSELLARHIDGLYIESAGDILVALHYLALAVAVFNATNVPNQRAAVYIFVGLGFLFRMCQAVWDTKRLRHAVGQGVS